MPATYAHYTFGKKVYKKLPKEIQQMVKENKEAYWLGLHGPDLLFYYRPLCKNKVNRLGNQMHREIATEFFELGREQYQQRPSYVLLSYLCGFLCHFMLDSECHPYISSYMEEHSLGHTEIETEFDRYLMVKDGKNPTTHCCTSHLVRDLDTEEVIASLFGFTADEIDESIRGFDFCIGALQCTSQAKAKLLKTVFAIIGQKEYFGGLIMTEEPHTHCQESNAFLEERLTKAVEPAARMIEAYVAAIETKEALSLRLARDFE